jgi:hypothetical protein
MFFWFVSLSVAGVLLVFRDPRLDHRLVALGSVLPLAVDFIIGAARGHFGEAGPFHAIVTMVSVLAVAMVSSIGNRVRRKRLLAVAIGGFAHLVLDGSWLDSKSFLWPITQQGFSARLQLLQRSLLLNIAMELVGIGAAFFLFKRCRLDNAARRKAFFAGGSMELLPARR